MAIKKLSILFSLATTILGLISVVSAQKQNAQENDQKPLKVNVLLTAKGFGGEWQLNRSQSDDVLQKLQGIFNSTNASFSAEKRDAKQEESPALSVSLFPPETLTVVNGDAEKEITINEGFKNVVLTRTVSVDKNVQIYEMRNGVNFSVKAIKQDNKLVIETVSPRGNKMIETYLLAPDASRLSVTVRFEDQTAKEVLTLQRVYDRTAMDIFLDETPDAIQ